MSCHSGDRVSQMGPLVLSCWESWVKCWPLETHACIGASRMISGSLLCICVCVFPASRFSCPATSNLSPSSAERILFIPRVGCLPHHIFPQYRVIVSCSNFLSLHLCSSLLPPEWSADSMGVDARIARNTNNSQITTQT